MRYLFLIATCFMVLGAVGYVAISELEKRLIYSVIRKSTQSASSALVGSFWAKYEMVFDIANKNPEIIKQVPQYHRFVSDLAHFFYPTGFNQVNLYTKNGLLFFQLYKDRLPYHLHEVVADYGSYVLYEGRRKGQFVAVISVDDDIAEDLKFFSMEIVYDMYDVLFWTNNVYAINVVFLLLAMTIVAIAGYRFVVQSNFELKQQYEVNFKLKNAKALAEQYSMNKSRFLANVSHELRTPLNSIIGFSLMIKKGEVALEKCVEYASIIHSAGTHLLSLINDILDLSKLEANKLDVSSEWFDLVRIIDVTYRMMLTKAQEVGVDLIKEFSNEDVPMKADPKRMKQVLINLISNSIKFTPKGGWVRVLVEIIDNSILIKVSDNGIGIAPEDIAKVMGAFGQVESHLSRRHSGTGLGLPLTRNLVQLMGGKFELISEPSKGTDVILSFPLLLHKEGEEESISDDLL